MSRRLRRLGIFYKEPVPGRVKTRLVPPLTPEEAADLYAAFLEDTLAMARRAAVDEVVLFDGSAPPGWAPPSGRDLRRHRQEGPDLGARMTAALEALLHPGFDGAPRSTAVLIGSDAPTLPPSVIEAGFERLETGAPDLVLGPAPDGGYVLIGVTRPTGDLLLSGIAWSAESTLSDTESRARDLGWRVARSPGGSDVDTPADLRRLLLELSATGRPEGESVALRTREVLSRVRGRIEDAGLPGNP